MDAIEMDGFFPKWSLEGEDIRLQVVSADGESLVTEGDLALICANIAGALLARGFSQGDAILVPTHGSLETAVTLVALVKYGFVAVPIDPKLGTSELAHVLSDAGIRGVISALPANYQGFETMLVRSLLAEGQQERSAPLAIQDLNAPVLLLYTSGTTGAPKGVELSTGNLQACIDGLREAWQWSKEDVVLHSLPLFHVHGLVLGLFGSLRCGAGLVWIPSFEPNLFSTMVSEYATVVFGVPTIYTRLADAAEKDPIVGKRLSKARLLISGSAPLSTRDHQRIKRLTGQDIFERYGMTETLITTAVKVEGGPRPQCVGYPLSQIELEVVGDDGMPVVCDGQSLGEVLVRGASVFAGYRNRPDATAEAFDAQGYFHTGDIAVREVDGCVRIVGRKSTDLIKCGGYKIGAGEIETVLLERPEISEVAVFGMPDDDLGERVVAAVVLHDPHEAHEALIKLFVDHVAARLSPHKRPREIRFLQKLPRNAMGKVQKAQLKK